MRNIYTGCSGSKVPKITASKTKKYLGIKHLEHNFISDLCIQDFYLNFLLLYLTDLKIPELK